VRLLPACIVFETF